MATLESTFQDFIDQLDAMIVAAQTPADMGVLQQQLERISKLIQDGLNIDLNIAELALNAVPNTRAVNGKTLDADINLDFSDVSAMRDDLFRGFNGLSVGVLESLDTNVVSNDLDDVVFNSCFRCFDSLNAPSAHRSVVQTLTYSGDWVCQTFWAIQYPGMYVRFRVNGVWSAWTTLYKA